MLKRWKQPVGGELAARLSAETGRSALLCAVLAARGYTEPGLADAFLSAGEQLASPFELMDMDKAVKRIHTAIGNGERIAVYGDYDCDGITSTALLVSYFQSVGADVIYYVPNRETEGYGLNKGAVDILRQQRVDLIVTVDNGISAHAEIAYAASLGMETVVTDHHTPRETLPEAVAVVNPHRADCPSRFKELAGVGVAFKLVCALEDAEASELLEYYSELVTLGTIADVMPLIDENRAIVRHGLSRMAESDNAGVRALVDVGGLAGKAITGESAAFGIIPRINAAGRVGIADDVIELLLTDDPETATAAAEQVNGQNAQRKAIEEQILTEIDWRLAAEPALLDGRLLILDGAGWHHGVVGIVASKLVERYGKPVILFSRDGEKARGSGRSVPGFSLIEAISACNGRLTQYGGHTLAAGLTLPEEALPDFVAEMEAYAAAFYPVMPVPEYRIDCGLAPEQLTVESIRALGCMEPFGAGNEQPVFLLEGLRVEGLYPTTDGKHLRIRLQFGNHLFYAIHFRVREPEFPFVKGDTVDLVAAVTVGEWNGSPQLSVRVMDIRPAGLEQEEAILSAARYASHRRGEYGTLCGKADLLPSREEVAMAYRYLRKNSPCYLSPEALFYRLSGTGMDYARLRVALDALLELGLVERSGTGLRVREDAPKVELSCSEILTALREEVVSV